MLQESPRAADSPVGGAAVEYGRYRYEVGEAIGGRFHVHARAAGGFGHVYLCYDPVQEYFYALKTLKLTQEALADPNTLSLFRREVAGWIALGEHPHIVRCFTLEVFDELPFMLLEWVTDTDELSQLYRTHHVPDPCFLDWYARMGAGGLLLRRNQAEANQDSAGTTLAKWLDRYTRLAPPFAVRLALDICAALTHAQSLDATFVHRDIKPANVLLDQQRRAKLSDFGTAGLVHDLLPGIVVGTPGYMAPEQARGESVDSRADIYALGCLLYEMLTGNLPFGESGDVDMFQSPTLPAFVPAALQEVVHCCLQPEPAARFASLAELTTALAAHARRRQNPSPVTQAHTQPATVEERNQVAVTYYNLEQYDLALAEFDHAIELDAIYPNTYTNRGCVYHVLGQHAKALADYTQAIRLGREAINGTVRSNRGLLYIAMGQPRRALNDLRRALGQDANHANAHHHQGLAYTYLGEFDKALASYNAALRANPTHVLAYHNRAYVLTQRGDIENALADYSAALEHDPTLRQAYINRSLLHRQLDNHAAAQADLMQLARLAQEDALPPDPTQAMLQMSRPDPTFLNVESLEDMIVRPFTQMAVAQRNWQALLGEPQQDPEHMPLRAFVRVEEVEYADWLHESVRAQQEKGERLTQLAVRLHILQGDHILQTFAGTRQCTLTMGEEAMRAMAAAGLHTIYDLRGRYLVLHNDFPDDIHHPLRIGAVH